MADPGIYWGRGGGGGHKLDTTGPDPLLPFFQETVLTGWNSEKKMYNSRHVGE